MAKNSVIVITGASKGIGREMAVKFSKSGAKVVLAARSFELMKSFSHELNPEHLIIKTDVREKKSVENMLSETIKKFGRIDVLINNAGIVEPYGIMDTTLDMWENILKTNLTGAFIVTQESLKYMMKTGGKIIYIASTAGIGARPERCAYAASKAGLINFAMSMAKALHQYNISVFSICPAGTATDLRKKLEPEEDPKLQLHPQDIVNVVEYCLTEQADIIDAQPIIVRLREN